jgi:hypothetical protein
VRLSRRRVGRLRLANRSNLKLNDIVVSQVDGGHQVLTITAAVDEEISVVYRGNGWTLMF